MSRGAAHSGEKISGQKKGHARVLRQRDIEAAEIERLCLVGL